MKVFALIGSSGTGKSYKAFMVAKDRDIDYIIDDGLLIGGTRILAGKSAKKESTRIAAVRRALFVEEEQRCEVINKIKELNAKRILVLGTSKRMIEQIVESLELSSDFEIIDIKDISTEFEMEIAKKSRKIDGKHVIPVPTVEVKKSFSGYFIDTLKIFRKKDKSSIETEKTIIRPTFSYLGKYELSSTALSQMIIHCASRVSGIKKVIDIKVDNTNTGIFVDITVVVTLQKRLDELLYEVQKNIVNDIEYITGLNVLSININAAKLEISSEDV